MSETGCDGSHISRVWSSIRKREVNPMRHHDLRAYKVTRELGHNSWRTGRANLSQTVFVNRSVFPRTEDGAHCDRDNDTSLR